VRRLDKSTGSFWFDDGGIVVFVFAFAFIVGGMVEADSGAFMVLVSYDDFGIWVYSHDLVL